MKHRNAKNGDLATKPESNSSQKGMWKRIPFYAPGVRHLL
jgi:hypothetical protein